ncbi:EF-P 5-aminopentanol modification-associated protein YfmF [Shouchella tritolerans]|uniref:EF-P 5-aminopentanol modification-associated protein YfmF n=1 Tax=Shouchella tritolerans TaxID=2979466 RepID=UPI0021E7DB7E|nr:pitrilysin family protein [Shouchella tritolerans]
MVDLQVSSSQRAGMNIHYWKTDKFKTVTFLLMAKAPLNERTLTARALIPSILQSGTKNYSNRKQLRRKLDDMYGAILTGDVQKKGEQHVLSFRMEIASERFLTGQQPLLKEALSLFKEVVFEPRLEDGSFTKAIVEQEKRALSQRIATIYDDKMRYANVRITEEMFKDEAFALPAYGRISDLDTLDEQAIYQAYERMVAEDRFDLYIIGTYDEKELTNYIEELFTQKRHPKAEVQAAAKSPVHITEKLVTEKQKVKQGKLHIGFRTHTTFGDEDYEAMQVANGIFGGFPSSKLFRNVREKESLAYYAASRLESHKGVLMVMAGIEFNKFERAVAIIKEQAEAMKTGEFDEETIEQTKAMLINQMLEAIDTPRGFVELSYHEMVAGTTYPIGERIEALKKVSKTDIVNAANKWELDTIYFLKGESE